MLQCLPKIVLWIKFTRIQDRVMDTKKRNLLDAYTVKMGNEYKVLLSSTTNRKSKMMVFY